MKTIYWLLLAAGLLASCEEEKLKTFDGQEGVYFYFPNERSNTVTYVDSTSQVEFGRVERDRDTLVAFLHVRVTGAAKDYPRKYKIVVIADSTTAIEGVNYEPLPDYFIMEAGACSAEAPIRCFRHDNINAGPRRLALQLVPTEDFIIGIPVWKISVTQTDTVNAARHSIWISGTLAEPRYWYYGGRADATTGQETGNWGAWSLKKFQVICELFPYLLYDDFTGSNSYAVQTRRRIFIAVSLGNYLQQQYDARTPILEEDGRLRWSGNVSWQSFVGVPWDGTFQ
jgi:hypothetical protein